MDFGWAIEPYGHVVTIIHPDIAEIKKVTDLPGLEDKLTSAIVNLWHQVRYVKMLEERIRELRKCQDTT